MNTKSNFRETKAQVNNTWAFAQDFRQYVDDLITFAAHLQPTKKEHDSWKRKGCDSYLRVATE